jgi:hypothetical protein
MSGTNPLPAGQIVILPPLAAGTLAQANGAGSVGQAASNARPLRGPPVAFVRQPDLGQPPRIQLCTGLGMGSGAGILNNGSDADQSQGLVVLRVGLGAAATGSVALFFPVTPTGIGQYVFLADWATLGGLALAGNTLSLTWSSPRQLIPGEQLVMAYQWAISQ